MAEFANKARIDDARSLRFSKSGDALLCDLGSKMLVWIPVSQIDDDSEVWEPNQTGQLVLNEWFAIKGGLV